MWRSCNFRQAKMLYQQSKNPCSDLLRVSNRINKHNQGVSNSELSPSSKIHCLLMGDVLYSTITQDKFRLERNLQVFFPTRDRGTSEHSAVWGYQDK